MLFICNPCVCVCMFMPPLERADQCVLTCAVSPQLVCLPTTTEHDSGHRRLQCAFVELDTDAQQGLSFVS